MYPADKLQIIYIYLGLATQSYYSSPLPFQREYKSLPYSLYKSTRHNYIPQSFGIIRCSLLFSFLANSSSIIYR